MRAHTPQQDQDIPRRRLSVTGGHRTSMGSTSIPVVQSRIRLARAQNQPAFDFLTGEPSNRPPSREFGRSARVSSGGAPPRDEPPAETDAEREKRKRELEELKAEIKTLKYTIDNHKQEDELSKLRHESELRDARRKAEEDFTAKQAAEAEKSKLQRQYDSLQKEVNEIKDNVTNEKAALERRLRETEESKRLLEEEVEDIKSQSEDSIRGAKRISSELEAKNESLQTTVHELQQDSDSREALLQDVQQKLAERDTTIGNLEAEVLRLKAQTGDVETLDIIKRELSEQVTHIRTLEMTNREQAAELKHYKRLHKSVEVVEEEKRSLQRKLDAAQGLENELGEARIQRQRLEDERLAWTAYLQSEATEDGQLEFESPEALARALVAERLQTASLFERIGALEPEVSAKDSTIQELEMEKAKLAEQMEKLRASQSSGGNSKIQLRLERQRALAVRESEFLRAQLKTYDTEDTTFQPESVDAAKQQRIQELEDMLDQYKQEVQTLMADLASREGAAPAPVDPVGTKRPRSTSEDSERLGQLLRKNRKLQDEISTLQTSTKLIQKELSVSQERLKAATAQSQTRILSLRSNPTSDFEAIKQSTLATLKQENTDLLARLHNTFSTNLTQVPLSVLEATRLEVSALRTELASSKTYNDRLRKVWGAKTAEFRELIISILGWTVTVMRDGKYKVSSAYYPANGDEENSIIFGMGQGTIKISGGPQSAFASRIGDQFKFWVKEKDSIPCFLAALTLEFYEEANRDGTMRVDV